MAFIDHSAKSIRLKVVYYGAEGSGKTANLRHIWERTKSPEAQSVQAQGAHSGVKHYDYLPMSLGAIRGYSTRLELLTVPGGEGNTESRSALLEAVDGLVFVADSRRPRLRANAASLEELDRLFRSKQLSLAKHPFVVQCNFSDAPDSASPAEVATPLIRWHPQPQSVPVFVTNAAAGVGVFETLKAISKGVLTELRRA